MFKQIITIATLLAGMITFAQNPISPPGVYIADPAAHVWNDGRLYVYGSLDITTDYYCSHRHHMLSTDNMVDWTLNQDVFASKGKAGPFVNGKEINLYGNNQIDPATIRDSILTEGEHFFHEGGTLVKRDGTYYFIYAHMGRAGRATCIAYATSDTPMGP